MLKASVGSGWKGVAYTTWRNIWLVVSYVVEDRLTKLFDVPQPLELRGVNERKQHGVQLNVPVNCVFYQLRRAFC